MKLFNKTLPAMVAAATAIGAVASMGAAVSLAAAGQAHAAEWCAYHVGVNGAGDGVECIPDPDPPPPPRPVGPHYSVYAAIAISSLTGDSGIAWHYESLDRAESVALGRCARLARDCVVQQWSDWCLSEAQGANGAWGTAPGYVIETARAGALAECRSGGGRACHITLEHCAQDTW